MLLAYDDLEDLLRGVRKATGDLRQEIIDKVKKAGPAGRRQLWSRYFNDVDTLWRQFTDDRVVRLEQAHGHLDELRRGRALEDIPGFEGIDHLTRSENRIWEAGRLLDERGDTA